MRSLNRNRRGVAKMRRILRVLAVLELYLGDEGVIAQAAGSTPAFRKPLTCTRFVPSGEGQTVGTVTALNPDCASKAPIVARVVEKPAHGDVSFENGDIFPNY